MPLDGYRNFETPNNCNGLITRTDPSSCQHLGAVCSPSLEASLLHRRESAGAWIVSVAAATARDHQNKEVLFKLLRGQGRSYDRIPDVLNTARRIITSGLVNIYKADKLACNPVCLALFKAVLLHALLRALQNASFQSSIEAMTIDDIPEPQQWRVVGEVLYEWELSIGGLAHACVEIFRFAYASDSKSEQFETFLTSNLLLERKNYWIELLMGLTWIRDAARSKDTLLLGCRLPFHQDLPTPLELFMSRVEAHLLEKLIFVPGSSMYRRMLTASCTNHNGFSQKCRAITPNDLVVHSTLRRLGLLASGRTVFLCRLAFKSLPDLILEPLIKSSCTLVGKLLSKHLPLMYDRHLTALLIGCIHHKANDIGLMVDIMTLKELATLHLPFHNEQTLQSVSLVPVGARKARDMAETGICFSLADEMGSIDEFYNKVLLPILASDGEDIFAK